MTKATTLITIVFLLLLTGGFIGWFFFHRSNTNRGHTTKNDALSDTYMTHVEATRYDTGGVITSVMRTPYLEYYTKQAMAEFKTPHITLYQQENPPWIIQAQMGQSIQNAKLITLWNNVQAIQGNSKTTTETKIKTQKIYYQPKKHFLFTDKHITLYRPGLTISADGMKTSLKDKVVHLTKKARGDYEN